MELYALIKVDYDYYTYTDLYGIFSDIHKAFDYALQINDDLRININDELEDEYEKQQLSHWYIAKYILNHRPLLDKEND